MPVQRIDIEQFLSLAASHPVLDVRSPGEYTHAHIPGAISFPLFTDEERKIVGTTYKQKSREQAIKIGLDFFGPTMKDKVVTAEQIAASFYKSDTPRNATLLVHCWRGGMRSAAIAWLLDLYGFTVYTLAGGYKRYRNWVLDELSKPHSLRVIGGYTGSGKTELLQALAKAGEAVIDLEKIASHKGSAFGSIGLPKQPGQEQFENNLADALYSLYATVSIPEEPVSAVSKSGRHSPLIWIEDESQRIGQVNLPSPFWTTMRQAPVYFLEIPFEERLSHIVEEYGALDKTALTDATIRITKKLGHLQAQQVADLLAENNIRAAFEILLRYYDKLYAKSLQNRTTLEQQLTKIESSKTGAENLRLVLKG
ncbi:MAG: tRNA 2-selenouridine(34) synthase MnmH [Sphingomonadales bacterium]|nr:tRNA 2-selenouridine(34) synthase MnmH [Sphingomonadales bacterium]